MQTKSNFWVAGVIIIVIFVFNFISSLLNIGLSSSGILINSPSFLVINLTLFFFLLAVIVRLLLKWLDVKYVHKKNEIYVKKYIIIATLVALYAYAFLIMQALGRE